MDDKIPLTDDDLETLRDEGSVDIGDGIVLTTRTSFKSYVDNVLDQYDHSRVPRDRLESSYEDKVEAKFYQIVPYTLHNALVEDDDIRVGDIYWEGIDSDEHEEDEGYIVVELFDER